MQTWHQNRIQRATLGLAGRCVGSYPLFALHLLERIPRSSSLRGEVLLMKAQVCVNLWRFDDALKIVNQLCKERPTAELLVLKGRILAGMFDFEAARKTWEEARLDGSNVVPHRIDWTLN